jgi:hypothetical protein
MAEKDLFQELKDALQDFKDFLDSNVSKIRDAVKVLIVIVPKIGDLIDGLVSLLNKLKTEVQKLDVGTIPGLSEVSEFTGKVTALLEGAKKVLPDDADEVVDDVLEISEVISGLPSVEEVKTEIISLIDEIIVHLNSLKPA